MAAVPATTLPDNVVMGVPKKGRLYERCMKLLAGAGMDHHRVSAYVLWYSCVVNPVHNSSATEVYVVLVRYSGGGSVNW